MGTEKQRATAAEAKAMAHPLRLRILRLCLDEELSNRELAERLDKDPATVLHHVRLLVDHGFLAAGESRRGRRNAREKPYRATRKSWVLDFGIASRTKIEVAVAEAFAAELRELAPEDVLESARMGTRLGRKDRDEVLGRIRDLIREIERREDPAGEPLGIYLAVHRRHVPDGDDTA